MRGIIRPDRLGIPYEHDGKIFIDAVAHAALTKGKPYAVHPAALAADVKDIDSSAGDVVGGVTAAPATLAVLHYIGAPQRDYDIGALATIQVGGEGELLVDGTTDVAKADTLEVLNTGVAAVKDGTARSVNTLAMAQSYDYIPPGKKLVGKRLVNDTGKDEPSAFETIERLKAQIRVLEQRVKSDEISDLALSLEAARKGLAHANDQVAELEQKVASLEATIEAQRQTIATQDDEAKMLRKAVAVKRGDAPPPLSPDMKEMAGLQEQLASAKQRITELEAAAEGKAPKKKEK